MVFLASPGLRQIAETHNLLSSFYTGIEFWTVTTF